MTSTFTFDLPTESSPSQPTTFVPYHQLFAYLVDHKRLTPQFGNLSQTVISKVKNSYTDLPDEIKDNFIQVQDSLKHFFSHFLIFSFCRCFQDLHYWTCDAIFQKIISQPNAGKKTLFGKYIDPLAQHWNLLLQQVLAIALHLLLNTFQFSKHNVHVGHAVQMLVRMITLDVFVDHPVIFFSSTFFLSPGFKRSIDRAERDVEALLKKEKDQLRSASLFMRDFESACTQNSIERGENLREGVMTQISLIPPLLANAILTHIVKSSFYFSSPSLLPHSLFQTPSVIQSRCIPNSVPIVRVLLAERGNPNAKAK